LNTVVRGTENTCEQLSVAGNVRVHPQQFRSTRAAQAPQACEDLIEDHRNPAHHATIDFHLEMRSKTLRIADSVVLCGSLK